MNQQGPHNHDTALRTDAINRCVQSRVMADLLMTENTQHVRTWQDAKRTIAEVRLIEVQAQGNHSR